MGGPLYYCKGLQQRFKETLGLSDDEAVFPEYARYAVALGTAIYAAECADKLNFDELCASIERSMGDKPIISALPPLRTERKFSTPTTPPITAIPLIL